MNKLNKNTIGLLFTMMLLSTSTFAQLICELDNRDRFFSKYDTFDEGFAFTENSGLAYHPLENMLIVTLDSPILEPIIPEPENHPKYVKRYILGYNLLKDEIFPIHISNLGNFMISVENQNSDFEGITHIKDNYFAVLEEKNNKVYFMEYIPEMAEMNILSGHATGIPSIGSDGLQGISFDPHTQRLFLVRDTDERLFSVSVNKLPGPNSNGEIIPYTEQQISDGINSIKIRISSDITNTNGLFHLGQIYPANHILSDNILVISQSSKLLIELDVKLNSANELFNENNGSLTEKKVIKFNEKSSVEGTEPKPGGVVAVGNIIYISSEKDLFTLNDGGISRYYIKSVNECCKEQVTLAKNSFNDFGTFLNTSYESSQSIVTGVTDELGVDVIIRECEAVDLKSNHITLNAGFKVEAGGCLNAEIKPCAE